MRAWRARKFGPFREVLRLEEIPRPRLTAGSALIRVHAAGINFADILMIAGRYQVRPPLPFIPGFEIAGEVVEIAGDGEGLAVGDRVMCPVETHAFCEYSRIAPRDAFAMPGGMTYSEAAAFQVIYQTAYLALAHRARLAAGEVLVVHGGAGGVGTAAIQLGKVLGATVIATAGGGDKVALCRRVGADHAIDHTRDDFVAAVREITGDRGADVIFDPVGGDVFDRSTRCLAWEGRILPIGFASGRIPSLALNRVLIKNVAVLGLYWSTYLRHAPQRVRETHDRLTALYRAGELRPVIYERYPMKRLPAALEAVASRLSYGKSVLLTRPGAEPDAGFAV